MLEHGVNAPNLGSQWNEGRGVERALYRNPEAQAKAVKLLIGLLKLYELGPQSREKLDRSAELKKIISDFTIRFPDFIIPGQIDVEVGAGYYTPDEQLLVEVHDILSSPGALGQ